MPPHPVEAAVAALLRGGLTAYPPEAVWGLGCDPFNQAAVRRLLAIKRDPTRPAHPDDCGSARCAFISRRSKRGMNNPAPAAPRSVCPCFYQRVDASRLNYMRVTSPLPAIALMVLATIDSAAAAQVTVYRCTDDRGRPTLGDAPCPKGQQQQVRQMLRPHDPPGRAAPAPPQPAPAAAVAPPTRVIVVTPPRPTYECITPDGEVYLGQSSTGELRWQPLWTLGYLPPGGHRRWDRPRFDHSPLQQRRDGLAPVASPRTLDGRLQPSGLVFDNVGRPAPKPPGDRAGAPVRPPATGIVYAAGAWVRDACWALPAQEVCARLRDRRYELDRRYHSALQSERARISQQQRGLDAQLASQCAAH